MYVTNTYLEITPKDIIKISSWLNNHWHTFSNSNIFFQSVFSCVISYLFSSFAI